MAAEVRAHPLVPFEIHGTNGYSVLIWGIGIRAPDREGGQVLIEVRRPGAEVVYVAPASVTEDSLEADLGALGEIHVNYRPLGRSKRVRSPCGGKGASLDPGVFEGTIDFHGENGYTEAHATRAEGDPTFLLELVCPGVAGPSGRGPHAPGGVLSVRPRAGRGRSFGFVAHKNRPGGHAFFSARIRERRGTLEIERSVRAQGSARTFAFDSRLRTAAVRPPAPFSGRAEFHRHAVPARRWTGSLSVDFPGRAGLRLTDTGARVALFHGEWDNSVR